ncbi:MAG TPA: hypothetical protein VN843_28620, partial [Anaerolineales bacterium]|nr:hypothetical protein [Anaerolineales bacterium]
MSKRNVLFAGTGFLILLILLLQIPALNSRVAWRYEVAKTYLRNVINPVGNAPTALPNTPASTTTSLPGPTGQITPTAEIVATPIPPTATLAPPPPQALLGSPPYEKQTANNCGPAALSMMLHMVGWSGSQKDISDVIKPVNGDRNVNPEEMAFWVRNYAGWLR